MQHLKIFIGGILKETGYLYFIKQIAGIYNIMGYAEFEKDGSLRISAEGNPKSLKRFIELIHIGSYNAHIDNYETKEIPLENYTSFEIQ